LTNNLSLSGYAGYTDAGYDKFNVLDASFVSHDLSGMQFYQTPKWNSRVNLSYDVPFAYGRLNISGGWYYQSSSSLYVLTFPQLIQPAYSLFDAHATWTSPNNMFDFSVWGTNLADKDYATGATASPVSPFDTSQGLNSAGLVAGDGRVIGATLTYHFGQ
jgi:iron complex outermembrane receptor protein